MNYLAYVVIALAVLAVVVTLLLRYGPPDRPLDAARRGPLGPPAGYVLSRNAAGEPEWRCPECHELSHEDHGVACSRRRR